MSLLLTRFAMKPESAQRSAPKTNPELRLLAILALAGAACAAEPIRLHPDNPHYFLFRGKPTVLVTSGEHYGAVLNAEFDFAVYL